MKSYGTRIYKTIDIHSAQFLFQILQHRLPVAVIAEEICWMEENTESIVLHYKNLACMRSHGTDFSLEYELTGKLAERDNIFRMMLPDIISDMLAT
jgi:hypothetical protein